LKYIYEENMDVPEELIADVAILALQRKLPGLAFHCELVIRDSIGYQNAVEIFQWAIAHPEAELVNRSVKHWIGYRVDKIEHTRQFKNASSGVRKKIKMLRVPGIWIEGQENNSLHNEKEEKCSIS